MRNMSRWAFSTLAPRWSGHVSGLLSRRTVSPLAMMVFTAAGAPFQGYVLEGT
jgi:hypothetical protein